LPFVDGDEPTLRQSRELVKKAAEGVGAFGERARSDGKSRVDTHDTALQSPT
jgi:hypothetical protein